MAEATNGIQQMAVMMLNPQFAAQQQKFALQQQLAQKMMEQGAEQPPNAQLANPGGMVIKNSPLGGAARGIQQALGAYMLQKNIADQAEAYKNMGQNNTTAPEDPNAPTMGEKLSGLLYGDKLATAGYEQRMKNTNMTTEAGLKTYTDANGVTHMVRDVMGGGAPTSAATPSPLPWQQPNTPPAASAIAKPPMEAPLPSMPDASSIPKAGGIGAPGGEVNLQMPNADASSAPPDNSNVPMAKDGKPFISSVTRNSYEEGAGPKYNTPTTKYGVETASALRDSDIKAYDKMGSQANNSSQMQGRLGYMEDALKSGNAGNIISQNPELANTLIAAGVISDKGAINDIAKFQAYEGAQVQEAINQIRSASPDSPQARVLAQEFNAISEKMGNPSQRPEAIHEIMAMTQGFADWNKDMAEGYRAMHGLDNRNANGATLRPVDYQMGFEKEHPVYDYVKMSRKEIGPFKGMAGNNSENRISILDPNGNAGTIDKAHLQSLLDAGGKLAQ